MQNGTGGEAQGDIFMSRDSRDQRTLCEAERDSRMAYGTVRTNSMAYGNTPQGQNDSKLTERRAYAAEKKRKKKEERRRRRKRYLMLSAVAVIAAAVIAVRLPGLPDGESDIAAGRGGGTDQTVKNGGSQIEELKALEPEYPQLSEVIDNISEYPQEIVNMFLTNRETIDYLTDYPQEHGKNHDTRIVREDYRGSIPLFLQWDERWGYNSYGSGLIGWTGCGPTCLSMAVVGLTGETKWNPAEVADFSEQCGYYTENSGTSWELMSDGAQRLGLQSSELPLDENRIRSVLDSGGVVICSVGPGDFTTEGHYILIRGYGNSGFIVNDPNSRERSELEWPYERLAGQIKNLWALSA